ncbi:hypothetical protein ACFWP5_37165 [Streptomyces sp. NPDC058469]|uniref:hypothetical protein n=1 Tax=Streptomyces sp. NPDC058469 TaxID=3346514 RepID=UPI00364F5B66
MEHPIPASYRVAQVIATIGLCVQFLLPVLIIRTETTPSGSHVSATCPGPCPGRRDRPGRLDAGELRGLHRELDRIETERANTGTDEDALIDEVFTAYDLLDPSHALVAGAVTVVRQLSGQLRRVRL